MQTEQNTWGTLLDTKIYLLGKEFRNLGTILKLV